MGEGGGELVLGRGQRGEGEEAAGVVGGLAEVERAWLEEGGLEGGDDGAGGSGGGEVLEEGEFGEDFGGGRAGGW